MKKTASVMCALACLGSAPAASADDLALAYFMGAAHPLTQTVFQPFSDGVADLSNGALTVTLYPAGALNGAPPRQYDAMRSGIADIVFHLPNYTPTVMPMTTAVKSPGVCSDARACTEAILRARDLLADEFDAEILALWATSPPVLFTTERAVRELSDLEGLLIGVTSSQDVPFIEALGASALSMSVAQVNRNLANGVVDGISIDPSALMSFRLDEVADYVTTWFPGSGSPHTLLMNRATFDGLSAEEQAWLHAAAGETLSRAGGDLYARLADIAFDRARAAGVKVIEFSPEARAEIEAAIAPTLAASHAQELRPGTTFLKVMNALRGDQ